MLLTGDLVTCRTGILLKLLSCKLSIAGYDEMWCRAEGALYIHNEQVTQLRLKVSLGSACLKLFGGVD